MLAPPGSDTFPRMLMRARSLPALIAVLGLLSLAGCPGGDDAQPERAAKVSSKKKEEAPPQPTGPSEPLELATKPVTGDQRLPVDLELETSEGKKKLGDLLAGNSLVVYMTPDTDERPNRAAHRMLRDVSRSGDAMGFRMVTIFTETLSESEVADFFRKRKIRSIGRVAFDPSGAFATASGWEPRSGALVGPDGQIGAAFGPTDSYQSRLGFDGGLNADLLFRAWEPAQGAPEVSAADRSAAVEVVRAVLKGDPVAADTGAPEAAAALTTPVAERVWVSLYRPGELRRLRGVSSAKTLGAAVAEATRDALLSAGDTASTWQARADEVRFAVDVAGPAQTLPTRELRSLWFLVEPGVDGVLLRKAGNEGVLLPHEPVTQGLLTPRKRGRDDKLEVMFKELGRRTGVSADAWSDESAELLRFRTTSFGVVQPGGGAVPMFRGNVLMDGTPDEARILESLRIGGLWLVNTVMEDGKFDYEYFPNQDKGSAGYNIVRHAGSVYGLFEMYHLASEEPALAADKDRYIDAASRAIGYIYDDTKAPDGAKEPNRRCLVSNNRCDSGSVALTLMTFLSRPDPKDVPAQYRDAIYRAEDEEIMGGLGLTLLDMIDGDGKVFASYREAMRESKVRKEPLYYPGEAMLALLRFHEKTGDERWLKGAQAIGDRQARWYADDRFEWPDHWVMQGWHPLWSATKRQDYATTAYNMAIHSISEQYPNVWNPWPDYHGAWRRKNDVPRTTRAGSRLEALRGVVHLAWDAGEDATAWEQAILDGADHLIEKQYRPENSWYLPNPDKALGAYPMGIVDNHLRIDNNQHALVGMVGALEVLRRRAGK